MTRDDEGLSAESLLERMADIAREFSELHSLDELLQRVVDLGKTHLTGCDGVSMMLVGAKGQVSSPAYSAAASYQNDMAQYEAGEGPCLQALREHHTVLISDLSTDERWPRYRETALQLGVRSMISFRLFSEHNTVGALNFYSKSAEAFDRYSQVIGQVFASHAAVAMRSAITESGLERALETRDVIGQAKGIIMLQEKVEPSAAFQRLVGISQRQNRPLREIALEIAESGAVPAN